MSVEMVFNELSLSAPFESKQIARKRMTQFIDTLRVSTSQGVQRKLCTKDDFIFLQLSSNYKIMQWWNDSAVEKEEQGFLKSLRNYSGLILYVEKV